MAKNIEPSLKTIWNYLKLSQDAFFVIPEYQRWYSWSIDQCDKLIQDIELYIENREIKDDYFFGTVIIDCSSDNSIFSLIDWQQRTTTFLLLLKAILLRLNIVIEKIPKDDDSEALLAWLNSNRNSIIKILYKVEDEDIPAIKKDSSKMKWIIILKNNSINELYPKEVSLILESNSFQEAEKNVHKIPRKQKDNKYTKHFKNFKFFIDFLSQKSDSELNVFAKTVLNKCQIIEIRSWQTEQAITMFNSLNSTGLPLSDSDIISAQLFSNAWSQKDEFNILWKEVNTMAEQLANKKITNIDWILQQYMYMNRAINKDYIKTWTPDVTTPWLRKYYIDIEKQLLDSPILLSQNFKKITIIWDVIKDYAVVKLLLKFNENAKLYLISYLYRFNPEQMREVDVIKISECLIKIFTILELVETWYSSKNFKTFLFGINIKLVDSDIHISHIDEIFRDHIISNWNSENLKIALWEYENNILVYLNEYLYAKKKWLSFDFSENTNVEHIMPASWRNIDAIRENAGINDTQEFQTIVNSLWNKILLEEDINKSISNEWFQTKKIHTIENKRWYKNSNFWIASHLSNFPKDTWEKQDILNAAEKASNRILEFIFS